MLAAAAGTLLLAGCKGLTALGPVPVPGADVGTLRTAIADEELLMARYQAALSALDATPAVDSLVRSVLAEHHDHRDRLRARLILPGGTAIGSASPSPTPTVPPVPAGRRQLLAELAAAEQAAARRLTRQLIGMPPATAQLMASISASEASHVVVLGQARRRV